MESPKLADQLVGTTAEELEADAAAKAALLHVLNPWAQKASAHQAPADLIHPAEGREGMSEPTDADLAICYPALLSDPEDFRRALEQDQWPMHKVELPDEEGE